MAEVEKSSLGELWDNLVVKPWPVWVAGIVLGFLNVCLFMVKSPWGGSGTYMNWGQNIYDALGLIEFPQVKNVFAYRYGVLGTMTLLGAMAAAFMTRQFSIRVGTIAELIKGLLGGVLMAIGATMGIGCTIGGFFSGWAALSGGALFTGLGLLIGSIIGLKYLVWEMEKLPFLNKGKRFVFFKVKNRKSKFQPIVGILLFLSLLIFSLTGMVESNVLTWFAVIGVFIGFICQRSQFCVVRAFREPFMTGMSEATVGVLAGIIVAMFGFTMIKYVGVGAANPEAVRSIEMTYVFPNFWLRGLIGGIIFGIGMLISGGCAVGTLWRAGEGHVKLWVTAVGFLLMAPISKVYIVPGFKEMLPEWARQKLFLPDYVDYGGAVGIMLVIILLWYMFVKWNEKTEKFSIM